MISLMKKVTGIITGAITTLTVALPAFAQNTNVKVCPEGTFAALCGIKAGDFSTYIGRVFSLLLALAVLIAVFFLIWGGVKWILSGGDKGGVEAARNTIIAAIIGLVVTFLAFFIISVVGQFFGIDLLNFSIPTIFK